MIADLLWDQRGRQSRSPSPSMPVIETIKNALHHGNDHATSKSEQHDAETEAKGGMTLPTSTSAPTPVFDNRQVTVIFVLGGPGVGKNLN